MRSLVYMPVASLQSLVQFLLFSPRGQNGIQYHYHGYHLRHSSFYTFTMPAASLSLPTPEPHVPVRPSKLMSHCHSQTIKPWSSTFDTQCRRTGCLGLFVWAVAMLPALSLVVPGQGKSNKHMYCSRNSLVFPLYYVLQSSDH